MLYTICTVPVSSLTGDSHRQCERTVSQLPTAMKHNSQNNVDAWNTDHARYYGARSVSFTERFMMKANQDPFVPIG